ncbi:MAG: hypothetical protein IT389_08955 [Nitrospira sp.]|nr:hypothetical protein [Nitrospira sp.]
MLARVADVFGRATPSADTPDLKTLHPKTGQLALENDFLEGTLIKAGLLSAKR